MTTETPAPATKPVLEAVLKRVGLPLVGERALRLLVLVLGDDELAPVLEHDNVVAARERLAWIARTWIEDSEGSRFTMNAGAVLLVVLALAHELRDTGAGPAPNATDWAPWLLAPDRRSLLLGGVATLVEDLHEQISLDEGRGPFIRAVRKLLDQIARLDPLALDVSGGRILIGAAAITFRRKGHRPTGHVAERRFLKTTNNEGRFFLLAAIGRAAPNASPSVISHVRGALESSGSSFRLTSDLELVPRPRLTRRAERAAARIRWSGVFQVRSVS